jgi:hypothetical protein
MKTITRISSFGTRFFQARIYYGVNSTYIIEHCDTSDICCIVNPDGSIEFYNYPCDEYLKLQIDELN